MKNHFGLAFLAVSMSIWLSSPVTPAHASGVNYSTTPVTTSGNSGDSQSAPSVGSLAGVTVIRAAVRSELIQKEHLFFSNLPDPIVMLTGILNMGNGVTERSWVAATTQQNTPKSKVRGAELLAGEYRVSLVCWAQLGGFHYYQSFQIDVSAQAGSEYVIECIGHPQYARQGDMHPISTKKPLLALTPGVTPLSAKCVSMSDVPLLPRLRAPKCTEDK